MRLPKQLWATVVKNHNLYGVTPETIMGFIDIYHIKCCINIIKIKKKQLLNKNNILPVCFTLEMKMREIQMLVKQIKRRSFCNE